MAFKHTINFVLNHPLNKHQRIRALWRFLKWQVTYRIGLQVSVFPFGEHSKIIVKKGMSGATGNLYAGLHEFEEMAFLMHFLRITDMFVDVGANVGSYSILASSERGAKTISIEPIPTTFEVLKDNILLNDIKDKVTCRNIALGNMKSVLKFTKSLDTVNHVARAQDTDTVDVRVERFDDIIELQQPTLVKIDVEGYETDVLQGMSKALINEQLKVVIIELNGSGKRYGYDEKKIHEKFLSYGFAPYSYEPYSRKLTPLSTFSSPNSLYVKDLSFVLDRLETAKSFKINGQVI